MNNWITFSETLPEKEDCYGSLNMEDITDTDYKQEAFETKKNKVNIIIYMFEMMCIWIFLKYKA